MFQEVLSQLASNTPPRSITFYAYMDVSKVRVKVEALKTNTSVSELKFSHDCIDTDGIKALAELLKTNNSLTTLILSGNEVDDVGVAALAKALEMNRSVTSLDLSLNKIGPEGAKALAKALETNTSVTAINLAINKVSDDGAEALSNVLENNPFLKSIDLRLNEVGSCGATALAEALETNTGLNHINLSENHIGPAGAAAIAKALRTNTRLKSLELQHNKLGEAGIKKLLAALEVNINLTTLNLRRNISTQISHPAQRIPLPTHHKNLFHRLMGSTDWSDFSLTVSTLEWLQYKLLVRNMKLDEVREKLSQITQDLTPKLVEENNEVIQITFPSFNVHEMETNIEATAKSLTYLEDKQSKLVAHDRENVLYEDVLDKVFTLTRNVEAFSTSANYITKFITSLSMTATQSLGQMRINATKETGSPHATFRASNKITSEIKSNIHHYFARKPQTKHDYRNILNLFLLMPKLDSDLTKIFTCSLGAFYLVTEEALQTLYPESTDGKLSNSQYIFENLGSNKDNIFEEINIIYPALKKQDQELFDKLTKKFYSKELFAEILPKLNASHYSFYRKINTVSKDTFSQEPSTQKKY